MSRMLCRESRTLKEGVKVFLYIVIYLSLVALLLLGLGLASGAIESAEADPGDVIEVVLDHPVLVTDVASITPVQEFFTWVAAGVVIVFLMAGMIVFTIYLAKGLRWLWTHRTPWDDGRHRRAYPSPPTKEDPPRRTEGGPGPHLHPCVTDFRKNLKEAQKMANHNTDKPDGPPRPEVQLDNTIQEPPSAFYDSDHPGGATRYNLGPDEEPPAPLTDTEVDQLAGTKFWADSRGNKLDAPWDPKDMIGEKILVLDHGFVCLEDVMGDDQAIANAARMSFGKAGDYPHEKNAKLVGHLMESGHTSPLEQVVMKLVIRMPIFVARQLVRHRMARINELSLRYTTAGGDFYIPGFDRLEETMGQPKKGTEWDPNRAEKIQGRIKAEAEHQYATYTALIADGVPKELAREVLGTGTYTEWVWNLDGHNLFKLLGLRLDPHAQWEIRRYAEAVEDFVRRAWPAAHEAWLEHWFNSRRLSASTVAGTKEIIEALVAFYNAEPGDGEPGGRLARAMGNNIDTIDKLARL